MSQRVKCRGCKQMVEREGCLRYGLGFVCDYACAHLISERRVRSGADPLPALVEEKFRQYVTPRPSRGTQPSAELRKRVRERDGNRCRWCQAADNLHVHHIVYRSEGGPHAEMNLVTLCFGCHERVHSSKMRYQPLLMELMRMQYKEAQFLTVAQLETRLAQRDYN